MIPTLTATYLTAGVEWVEAYTILLAVALSIGWRQTATAALAALATLAILTAIASTFLSRIQNLAALQFVIGFILILFGIRWLAKAIARAAGLKKLHNEAEEFAALRSSPDIAETGAAMLIAYNGVLLEGLEVWLIVVALGVQSHHTIAAATAAIAAALTVTAAGFFIRAPLSKVPENTIKFTVGAGILAFGTFWTMESLRYTWPFAEFCLPILFAINITGGLAITQLYRTRAPA